MADLVWVFNPQPRTLAQNWEWPAAFYSGPLQKIAGYIVCDRPYNDIYMKMSAPSPLAVVIHRYNVPNQNPAKPNRMLSDQRFITLKEAIQFVETYLQRHREWQPTII